MRCSHDILHQAFLPLVFETAFPALGAAFGAVFGAGAGFGAAFGAAVRPGPASHGVKNFFAFLSGRNLC